MELNNINPMFVKNYMQYDGKQIKCFNKLKFQCCLINFSTNIRIRSFLEYKNELLKKYVNVNECYFFDFNRNESYTLNYTGSLETKLSLSCR